MADGSFRSVCCEGEFCICGNLAHHKVEEVVFPDDPDKGRHPFTSYLCIDCFNAVMGVTNG